MTKTAIKHLLLNYGPLVALLVIYLLFALIAPASFSTFRNLETIVRQTSIVGVAATWYDAGHYYGRHRFVCWLNYCP